jgi:hypothetical protein
MRTLIAASRCILLSVTVLFAVPAIAGTPVVKKMKYISHWKNEDDPWADMTLTVTPPDDGVTLPAQTRLKLETVYILGTRKDLFCHMQYFKYSLVTRTNGGTWISQNTSSGTLTGCPNAAQPRHVVEFTTALAAGGSEQSIDFHIYTDGASGFCPRPDARNRASLKLTGKIVWTTNGGKLQACTVTINNAEQPQNLNGCNQVPNPNSQSNNYPTRVIDRPVAFDQGTNVCPQWTDPHGGPLAAAPTAPQCGTATTWIPPCASAGCVYVTPGCRCGSCCTCRGWKRSYWCR